MRASNASFAAYLRNPEPKIEDSVKKAPRNKPHPPVPTLNLNFVEATNNENEQPKNPRNKRINASKPSARRSNPRFKRSGPSTARAGATNLNPVISEAPITPAEAKAKYSGLLNSYEMEEIDQYPEIYFLGHKMKKVKPNVTGVSNYGYDDSGHHYRSHVGDHIAYRYEIRAVLGKGAFGQVLRVFDHKTKTNVALKLIINTQQMHDQGRIEVALVKELNEDPGVEKAHIIRGFDFFVFRRHICATFEILGSNLYEYSRSLRFRPLGSTQMRSIAQGMLKAIAFMHAHNVCHCDLKPENVLLAPNSTTDVRVIDFGSSCRVGQQRYEYIQSRFYRAPEVVLGVRYGPPMDMWSFGCIVAELMTGRPLFPGDDEEELMQMYMEVFGVPPRSMLERCSRRKYFFTSDYKPIMTAKNRKRRKVASTSLRTLTHINDNLLLDLLSKCFEWDQNKRITAQDALKHPWFAIKEIQSARGFRMATTPRWR